MSLVGLAFLKALVQVRATPNRKIRGTPMSRKSDDQLRNVTPPGAIDLDAGRRAFFRNVGLGAVGAAVLGSGLGIPSEAQAQAIDDADILNFALNLEYLEAEFYLRAAFGRGLRDDDVSGQGELGPVSGGRRVNFATRQVRNYAEEIARDEENHVQFSVVHLVVPGLRGHGST
jgi:hypothetical protein